MAVCWAGFLAFGLLDALGQNPRKIIEWAVAKNLRGG
jgi:hypothetical protein